jgi:hypothetical protein
MREWLDARHEAPLHNVTPHAHHFVVNVGLPRTGTTSFALACKAIGLRTVHSWSPPGGRGRSEHSRDYWWREHYATVLRGVPGPLDASDALADTPFYSRAPEFARAYPNATFVCTTRSASSWVDSMTFGHLGAGGLYLPRRYGLRGPPYPNSTASRHNLTRLFHGHAPTAHTQCTYSPLHACTRLTAACALCV